MKSPLRYLSSRIARRPVSGLTWSDPDGRRPENNGPPDLEEIWQRFVRQVRGLLPGRPALGGPGGSPLKTAGAGAIGIGAALAIFWLFSGVFTVQEGSAGVVLQFGAYKYTTGSGLWYHWPRPFQSVEIVSLSQVRSVEIGRNSSIHATNLKDQSMLTADENIIDVRFAVQFHVKDPVAYLFNNASPDDTVVQAAETAVREIVGRSNMDDVFGEGRGKIEVALQQSIQHLLDTYKTGILVTSVTLQQVQPPEQVQAAFDDAVKATQDRERQKNEGQAYANDVIPRARGDAARVIAEAEGYQAEVVANAEGDADRFKKVLGEYAKAPAVTRQRMYLQTMQDIFSRTTKILVDSHATGNTLYIPLNKLLGDNGSDGAPAPGNSGASPATMPAAPAFPNVNDADRSRDPIRARERDAR